MCILLLTSIGALFESSTVRGAVAIHLFGRIAYRQRRSAVSAGPISARKYTGRAGSIDGVMATSNYGNNTIATALERHPNFAKIACWSTILAETAFPAIYLLPTRFVSPTLAVVLFFHITVGYAMGLPRFIWAFGATHPAILYVCKKSEKKSAA
ncbi:Uncharacterised protein [Mycobacteroides abscessus subsp. abscessus]|nr:Uncharacterised protein [Mycobacteroides abscessus subsp. abscessus]